MAASRFFALISRRVRRRLLADESCPAAASASAMAASASFSTTVSFHGPKPVA